jgi:hypothetical protein
LVPARPMAGDGQRPLTRPQGSMCPGRGARGGVLTMVFPPGLHPPRPSDRPTVLSRATPAPAHQHRHCAPISLPPSGKAMPGNPACTYDCQQADTSGSRSGPERRTCSCSRHPYEPQTASNWQPGERLGGRPRRQWPPWAEGFPMAETTVRSAKMSFTRAQAVNGGRGRCGERVAVNGTPVVPKLCPPGRLGLVVDQASDVSWSPSGAFARRLRGCRGTAR